MLSKGLIGGLIVVCDPKCKIVRLYERVRIRDKQRIKNCDQLIIIIIIVDQIGNISNILFVYFYIIHI